MGAPDGAYDPAAASQVMGEMREGRTPSLKTRWHCGHDIGCMPNSGLALDLP
jgi:hypothetical protein